MTKTGSGVKGMNRPLCDPVDGKAHRCLPYWRMGDKEMDENRKETIGKKREILTLYYGDVPDGEKVKRNHHRFVEFLEKYRTQRHEKSVGDGE
jgi:hypothetical protein